VKTVGKQGVAEQLRLGIYNNGTGAVTNNNTPLIILH
jgi:hypothetical protein